MNTPSSLEAAGHAWARTQRILFTPFDIGRWFTIGFSAWLALIGSGSGGGNFSNFGDGLQSRNVEAGNPFQALVEQCLTALEKPWVIGLVIGVVFVSFVLGLFFCWLRSHGDFMFVHHLYQPNSSIKDCWQRSKQHANSLFQYRLLFFVVALGFFAFDGYLVWKQLVQPWVNNGYQWSSALAMPLFIHIALLLVMLLALQILIIFMKDFVVPIMYWQNCSASTAWTLVLGLCNEHPFAVIGYLLCMMLWTMLGGIAIILLVVCTCCIAFIPLVIPYISAVLMLPFTLFLRAYPIYFLSQWKPARVPAPAEASSPLVIDINIPPTPPSFT